MNPINPDSASFDEEDPILWEWQHFSPGAINNASRAPQLSRQFAFSLSQYGPTLQNNPPMNGTSDPFFATPASVPNFGSFNNQPHTSGNIAQQPLHYHNSPQISQHNAYTPSTEEARSLNDGYTAPRHSTTNSGYGNHATYQNFFDSGLSTTPGCNYDGSRNGYLASASGSVQPSTYTAQTQDFDSSISDTSPNYFPIASNSQVQQSAQSLQPPHIGRRYGANFLEVPIQVPGGSFNCVRCDETSRTASEHK